MALRANTAVLRSERSGLTECLDRLVAQKGSNRPVATYRLQLHSGFRFADALRLVPYLHALGITHLYTSPVLQARAGSSHGYDITNHDNLNPEIGSEQDFALLVRELKARDMGLLLDVVPNHMGVGQGETPWWQDVLENGRASEYADFFDIDWQPLKTEMRNKVLIPILGDAYGEELEKGELRLARDGGRIFLRYYDKPLPLDPQTWPMIFETLGDLREQAPEMRPEESERAELENILFALRQLPPHCASEPEAAVRRQRDAAALKKRFAELLARSAEVTALVDEAIRRANGNPGEAQSFDALHRLLEGQAYRLAYWRVSSEEINYRRFFDINDLVGLRMDNPRVFAATHRLFRRLLAEDCISGLRLDHPDGLLNPIQYFTRVQMLYAASQCVGPDPEGTTADNGIELAVQEAFGQHDWMNRNAPLYVIVEKILEPGETLPRDWPVDGTVGYDFVRAINGVFIDQRSERAFTNLYRRFIGGPIDPEKLIYESKKLVLLSSLSSELTVLTHILEELSGADRRARDFTRVALSQAIRETIACFPVYRTYIDERGQMSERDRTCLERAISTAKRRNPGITRLLFDWLQDVLLMRQGDYAGSDWQRERLRFVLKFQQLTGPVMAKGLEDTACYVYNRFVSSNEVGCTPAEFGLPLEEFHRGNQERGEHWPFSLLATSTHDTKRSEDVRARLNVLSEMPREWTATVMRWRKLNRSRRRTLSDQRMVPDYNEEYLLYQMLVGAWPLVFNAAGQRADFLRRIQQYMTKALHEAKVNLSWVNQNAEYVTALDGFIERILEDGKPSRPNLFLRDIENFIERIGWFGMLNSLAQTLVKITAPGVPDIYQGNELFDFSLVDPDNRRPVDFALRMNRLQELTGARTEHNEAGKEASSTEARVSELLANWRDGGVKLWLMLRALNFRRAHPALFQQGAYLPLSASGEYREHVLGFAREHQGQAAIVAVPRFAWTLTRGRAQMNLAEAWDDAELPLPLGYTEFVNILTDEKLCAGSRRTLLCREVFARFPVALLAAR